MLGLKSPTFPRSFLNPINENTLVLKRSNSNDRLAARGEPRETIDVNNER